VPALDAEEYWGTKEAALVISFTNRNKGDLHKSVRDANGYNPGSHKTHIDITSGGDVPIGQSPVLDFLDARPELGDREFEARLNRQNLKSLSSPKGLSADWENFQFHITPFSRNDDTNPSVQLLQYGDLLPLREILDIGDSMIFVKDVGGVFDVFGVRTDDKIKEILPDKTKRMFLNDHPVSVKPDYTDEAQVQPEEDKGTKSKPSRTSARPTRVQDPKIRRLIEARGMQVVREHFEKAECSVVDVHTAEKAISAGLDPYPGFDQQVHKGEDVVANCETKATTTNGAYVELTLNELENLIKDDLARLCVVHSISLKSNAGDEPVAIGGKLVQLKVQRKTELERTVQGVAAINENLETIDAIVSSSSIKITVSTKTDAFQIVTE
jgi:hypothetical protein